MLDSHCHLDHYPDPIGVMRTAEQKKSFIVAVTNLPSHFIAGRSHVRPFRMVRLALGLHPLSAPDHAAELKLFEQQFAFTSFIGEVGLDFSSAGRATMAQQLETFRFVARLASASPKFLTLHSRAAERAVLDVLQEFSLPPAVFHWYTGSLPVLSNILHSGHYISINPSMVTSAKGKKIIEATPPDRVLTESDGPYGRASGAPAHPWDVSVVETYLSSVWVKPTHEVRSLVWQNFKKLVPRGGAM